MAELAVEFKLIPKLDLTAVKTAMSGAEKIVLNTAETSKKAFEGIGETIKKSIGSVDLSQIANFTGAGLATGAITGAVSSITEAFSDAIKIGASFQKELNALGAITGNSGAALDALGSSAKDLAGKFGGDVNSQLGAFQGLLSKLGPNLATNKEALIQVTENVNLLAKAGGLDAKDAMEALTTVMLQFGIDASDPIKAAKESARIMNIMAAGAKEGAAEIPQVAEALKQAGVAAKSANLGIEETNAAIQQLATGGKVGSEAGISLRNVLSKLQMQSGEGDKELKKLGLTTLKLGTDLQNGGLGKALDSLKGGLEKIKDPVEKNQVIMQLFGAETAASASILLDGSASMQKMTKAITGTDEATIQAQKNMAGYTEKMSQLTAKLDNIKIGAFLLIEPIISGIIDKILAGFDFLSSGIAKVTGLIANSPFAQLLKSAFDSVYNSVVSLIPTIDQLKGIFNSIVGVLDYISTPLKVVAASFIFYQTAVTASTIATNASTIATNAAAFAKGVFNGVIEFGSGLMTKVTGAIKAMASSSTLLAAKIYLTAAAQTVWNGIQAVFNGLMALNPLGIAIIVLAALTGAIIYAYKNSETFRKVIDGLWLKVKEFIGTVVDAGKAIAKFFGFGDKKKEIKAEVKVDGAEEAKQKIEDTQKAEAGAQAKTDKAKKEKTKSLLNEIAKAEAENIKLINGIKNAAIEDERDRTLQIVKDKTGDDISIVQDEIKKIKLEKNLVASEKIKLIKILNEKIKLVALEGNDKLIEADSKFALKKLEEQKKTSELTLKNSLEIKKKEIELLAIQGGNESTFDGLKQNAEIQKQLKLELLRAENEIQINEYVNSNSKFLEVDKKYLEAKAKLTAQNNLLLSQIADKVNIDTINRTKQQIEEQTKLMESLQTNLSNIENNLRKDPIVKVLTLKLDEQNKKVIDDFENQQRETDIKSIKDSNEREGATKIYEAEKTYKKDLELAKDNEDAKFDAYMKFIAAKNNAEDEASKKSTKLKDIAKNGFLDIADAFKNSMITATTIVADSISSLQAKLDSLTKPKENNDALKSLEVEAKNVFESYKKREITISEYYQKSSDLEQKRLVEAQKSNSTASIFEIKARLAIAKSFENIAKKSNDALMKSSQAYISVLSDANVTDEQRGKLLNTTYAAAAVSVGASLGAILASGENAAKGFLLLALDTLQSLVPIIIAQLFGVSVASQSLAGVATAAGLTLVFTALVQTAKAAASGFKTGVVDLAGPGTETSDSIPAYLSRRESVVTAAGTKANGNADALRWVNKTGGSLVDYFVKIKPELILPKSAITSQLEQKRINLSEQQISFSIAQQLYKKNSSVDNSKELNLIVEKILKENQSILKENQSIKVEIKKLHSTFSSKHSVEVTGNMEMNSSKVIAEIKKSKIRSLSL